MSLVDRKPLRSKLRFLLEQGASDVVIDLAIDAVVTWVSEGHWAGSKGVTARVIGQNSDPVSGLLSPISSPDLSEAKSSRNADVMGPFPPGFAQFWGVFWRRVKRAKAIAAWVKLAPDPQLTQVIVAAVEAQRKEQLEREPKFRPHAATWLNGREWENEADAPQQRALVLSNGHTPARNFREEVTADAFVRSRPARGGGEP